MDDKERYQSGADARRKILGDAWVDRADAGKTAFTAEWQDFITRCAWGEVWTRPHFEERTRRILVIGTMMAIGRWEEFRMHVRAALVEGGFSADDLKEIILQQAIYCGVPVGNHAFREAAAVLKEVGKASNPLERRRRCVSSRHEDQGRAGDKSDSDDATRDIEHARPQGHTSDICTCVVFGGGRPRHRQSR